MKFTILIVLCSVILGGLAQSSTDDSNVTLSSCQSNPYIRIEKVNRGYQLSLCSQNTWWAAVCNNNKWIRCKDLCNTCRSLPGIDENGENKFGQLLLI